MESGVGGTPGVLVAGRAASSDSRSAYDTVTAPTRHTVAPSVTCHQTKSPLRTCSTMRAASSSKTSPVTSTTVLVSLGVVRRLRFGSASTPTWRQSRGQSVAFAISSCHVGGYVGPNLKLTMAPYLGHFHFTKYSLHVMTSSPFHYTTYIWWNCPHFTVHSSTRSIALCLGNLISLQFMVLPPFH